MNDMIFDFYVEFFVSVKSLKYHFPPYFINVIIPILSVIFPFCFFFFCLLSNLAIHILYLLHIHKTI